MNEQQAKQRRHRKQSCHQTGKARFKSETQAMRRLQQILSNPAPGRKPVRAHYCSDCAGWHLTSMKAGDGRYDYHL